MNSKQVKRVHRHVEVLLTEWLQEMLPEEQAEKITPNNFREYLPSDPYYWSNFKLNLNSYSPRWVKKYIKRIIKKSKNINIEDITIADIEIEAGGL